MKKFLSIILAILIFCMIPVSSYAETEEKGTPLTKQLFKFMQDGSYQNMYIDSNYGYENFLNDFESNPLSQYFFHMADLLIETGTEPSEKKYRDVLIGLMGSYDLENAADLGKQNRQDHLKSLEDYGKDAMDIMKDAASLTIAKYPNLSEMDSFFFTAIEGIYTMKDNVENLITTFSDLETVLQNYSLYDSFLKTVEEHAGDHTDLKNAASSLRNSMAKVMEYRMTAYREASNDNFENWGKYFFSDAFFTAVKQIPEYTSDDTMRFFVDGAENFIGKVNILKDSWNLGVKIGTLVGNLTVGGENLIDRVLEMMAVQDIADSLKNGWDEQWNEFGDLIGTENEIPAANQLVSCMKYLGLCRIRGEYCLYSILEKDAGLLSWFNEKTQKQAKEWYNTQSGIVSDILIILKNAEEQAKEEEDKKNIFTPEYVENLYLDFLKSGKYESDSTGWINPASKYCIFDINDDGISELLVMGEEMSFQHCLIYTLDLDNKEVTLINSTYYYATLRYSPAHKAIVYTYPRPMMGASESYFDIMDGMSFENIISLEIVGEDHYCNDTLISKTEYQQYFSELIYFEFIDIPVEQEESSSQSQPEKVTNKEELSNYIGMDIEKFVNKIGNLKKLPNQSAEKVYANEYLFVCAAATVSDTVEYPINILSISGESDYCLEGLYYGMSEEEAENHLIDTGWTYYQNSSSQDSMYKNGNGNTLTITSDGNTISMIELFCP